METKPITNRYDFIFLLDVKDGNPNGDPDAGNLPRVDSETGEGLITDVCLKRKVRNYVQSVKEASERFDIFIKEKAILNELIEKAHADKKFSSTSKGGEKTEAARQFMCHHYYDVRTFGAVMSTGKNAGQVRGPIQMTFARSISPIMSYEHTITRMAIADKKDESNTGDNRTMGRKSTVPYGLYRTHGFISANLAKQTGFDTDDLNLFWEALANMFDTDRSAARGLMSARKLIVFKHDSELGNAPANLLFDRIKVELKNPACPPRSFDDYQINIDKTNLPAGIEIIERI